MADPSAPVPSFPLTKTFDPADLTVALATEAALVNRYDLSNQATSAGRQWEYAMALKAIRCWSASRLDGFPVPLVHLDVGGFGSPFVHILATQYEVQSVVVDPSLNHSIEFEAEFRRPPASVDVITAISVLEHVKEWRTFLRACGALLKPGGLLFLTLDYWDAHGKDTAHFHWMRERIYNRDSIQDVLQILREVGVVRYGPVDWTYRGNQVYGEYSFLAVTLEKKGATA